MDLRAEDPAATGRRCFPVLTADPLDLDEALEPALVESTLELLAARS